MDPIARRRTLRAGVVVGVLSAWLLPIGTQSAHAAPPEPCAEVECIFVEGEVLEAGERTPIPGARVLVVPAPADQKPGTVAPRTSMQEPAWVRATETDADGHFELEDLPKGKVRVIVIREGHKRQAWIVEVPLRRKRLRLFLRPSDNRYRTLVEAEVERTEAGPPTQRSLGREEIDTVPGAQGDVLRSLKSMPGVTRAAGGFGEIVLRGASPTQSVLYVGTQRVPRAFHLPGIASVVPSGAVEGVEVVPGNFDVAYGNATGGLLHIMPRAGRRDGHHGYAELDLGGLGALAEGPIGKRRWSYLVGAQRSHLDLVVRGVHRVDPNANLSEPRYYDYQAFFDQKRPGAKFGIHLLGSSDRLVTPNPFVPATPSFDFRAAFHRIDVTSEHDFGPFTFLVSPGFRFDRGASMSPIQGLEEGRYDYVVTLRTELRRTLGRRSRLRLGTEAELDFFNWSRSGREFSEDGAGLQTAMAAYGAVDLRLGPVTLSPGVRHTVFTLGSISRSATDPRGSLRWDITDRVHWTTGLGMYTGAASLGDFAGPNVVAGNFSTPEGGNIEVPGSLRALFNRAVRVETTDLRLARALQASTSVGAKLPWELELELTGFLRRRIVHRAPVRESGLPNARGINWNYGAELLLRKRLSQRLYGWVGYTLMWATNLVPEQRFADRRVFPNRFDQRHNLVAVLSYALPRHWRIGGRFRLASGLPYTPIVATVQSEFNAGVAQPLFGAPNSQRFPVYHQLDLRIDRTFYARYATVLLYLDIQNIYNRANTEVFVYSPDYSRQVGSVGLPIFPSLGLRVAY